MTATTWLEVGTYAKLDAMETAASNIWLAAYSELALPAMTPTRVM